MEDMTELIIEAILPHISCTHDEVHDEDGVHDCVEYNIDNKCKPELERLILSKFKPRKVNQIKG